MRTLTYLTLDKDVQQLRQTEVDAFAARISGGLLTAADSRYDEARKVWNGTVDRRPALIARSLNNADVQSAVRFASAHGMLVSVRGGGHHIAGNAVAEGGLMIDLSGMRDVSVDVRNRTARVGPGALLGDFDRAAQAHGLATPLGINSTTGVAGLTLGGGFGWLTRRYGMTIDNLLAATVVTADGEMRVVSESSEPDLFWAVRGGGGNFGVATSFQFQLHPVGPEIYAGLIVYPFEQAQRVLRAWRDFTAHAPDELSVWGLLRQAPPLPFLPASVHGTEVVVLVVAYSGDAVAGQRAAAPLLEFGNPVGSALGPTPYAGFQSAFDALLTPGGRNYWKSNNFRSLTDSALDMVIESAAQLPGPECEIFLAQLGAAMARVDPSATAYVARDAHYIMNVHGRWSDPRDDDRIREWARKVFRNAAPYGTGSGYVNFLIDDESERVVASYGINYPRLQTVKRRFDPDNLFRMNLNIKPAAPGAEQRSPVRAPATLPDPAE
jgi:FAD/FMN-containing dehydrogenase